MKRSSRLTKSDEINRVRRDGKSFVHHSVVLGVLPNQLELQENRAAVIAGRSIGGAVQRNLAKRRLRSAYQYFESQLQQGYDLVLIARRPILDADYQLLLGAMKALFDQAGLMKEQVR